MVIQYINTSQMISLQDFLADALNTVGQSGVSPLVILSENKPAFYVLQPHVWDLISEGKNPFPERRTGPTRDASTPVFASQTPLGQSERGPSSHQKSFQKQNNFSRLADQLLDAEWERVSRNELSAGSVGIQKNRLEAHVLPFSGTSHPRR